MHATEFRYMESAPKLQGKARQYGASYRRMAVVEHETGKVPKMISTRAVGVVRIVSEVTASVGTTDRSEGFRARQALQALAARLNRERVG